MNNKSGCSKLLFSPLRLGLSIIIVMAIGSVKAAEPSTAYKVASLDAGKMLNPEDRIIARYQTVLSILAKRFETSETTIADQTLAVVKSLHKRNVKTTLLEFMEAIAKMKEDKEMKLDYPTTIAVVATLMSAPSDQE